MFPIYLSFLSYFSLVRVQLWNNEVLYQTLETPNIFHNLLILTLQHKIYYPSSLPSCNTESFISRDLRCTIAPPLSVGDTFQYLQWVPGITDSTEPCNYFVFSYEMRRVERHYRQHDSLRLLLNLLSVRKRIMRLQTMLTMGKLNDGKWNHRFLLHEKSTKGNVHYHCEGRKKKRKNLKILKNSEERKNLLNLL